MSRQSPYVIGLSDAERAVLEERSRAYRAPFGAVIRARIVLPAADGAANTAIAQRGRAPRCRSSACCSAVLLTMPSAGRAGRSPRSARGVGCPGRRAAAG